MRWTPNKHKQRKYDKQLETKTSRTSLLCGNRKGTQNVDT